MNFELFFNELNKFLSNLLNSIIELLPLFASSLIVLLVGYFIGRLFRFLTKKFINNLPRLFINKKIKNRLYQVNFEHSAIHISNIVFWMILFFTLLLISEIIGVQIITAWFSGIVYFLPNILVAVVIIFFGIICGRLAGNLIVSAANQADISYGNVIGKMAQYGLLFISIIIAVDQLGIEISFLIHIIDIVLAALLFGAALAFGLGAKLSVSNILASYYIHHNYKEGDRVKIDEIEGQIVKINSNSVVLNTKEGQVNIPAKLFSDKISFLLNKVQQ
jgi:small-conductance mechanosensitive channel